MSNFRNFGTGLGQAAGTTTMVNPFFAWNGPFTAEVVQGVQGMVAYYPANFRHKKIREGERRGMHGASRGFVHGYVGPILGSPRAMGR